MKRIVVALLALALLVALAGALFWLDARRFGGSPSGQGEVVVNIPAGIGPRRLAKLLAVAGATSDESKLERHLRWFRRGLKLKVGEYAPWRTAPSSTPCIATDGSG